MDAILADVRALDLSRGMAGVVTGMLLAEAGADVAWMASQARPATADQAIFAFANRSKRQLNEDLSTAIGRDALHVQLANVDILVHDFTPDEAAALGLDDAALQARHPHLIAVSVTGFPAGHPDRAVPAIDSLVLASMGVLDEQQPMRRDGPMFIRFPLGSWGAAWLAAIGAVTRLIARDRGMRPGPVRTSLAQGALLPLAMHWYRAERPSPSLSSGLPKTADVSLFQCADGVWLHIMSNADHVPMVQEAIAALPERYRVPVSDGTAFRTLFPLFDAYKQAFPTRPSAEWLATLRAADVAVQPVLDIGELYDDEQVASNGLVATVEDGALGRTRQPAVPILMDPPFRIGPSAAPRPRRAEASSAQASARYPLQGLRILDLGTHLAGPLAPMLAADLGAEVIKVESISGDQMRWVEWCFISCQRGKRSIALQLKDPRARPVLERLVGWADVVHHNMRMPAARKLGLDYETLRAINPALIYTHVSAYGAQGPRKDWPGFDQLFQASGGWEKLCAGEGNPPTWLRFGMIDHQVALASLYGTLLALRRRDRTGEGQFVSSSLLGAALFTCGETVQLADGTRTPAARLDPMQMGVGDRHRLFQCADGWVLMMAEADEVWHAVLEAAAADGAAQLEQRLLQVGVAAAVAMLRGAGAAAVEAKLGQRDAFFDSAANRQAGLVAELGHPAYGRLEIAGRYLDFGDLENRIERAPPTLGQHSREILAELGVDEGEIETLIHDKVVV